MAAEELAIAAADVACRGGLDRVRQEFTGGYQGELIAEHRSQVEEIAAWSSS